MPIIEMHMMEGRTAEQKSAAARAVTDALVHSLGVRVDAVRIMITEHRADGFFVAGQTMAQRTAAQSAPISEEQN